MKTARHSTLSFTPLFVWCYHALFLITPFLFTWVNSELFEFNKMLFVFAIAITVGSLWIARMVMEKRVIWNAHPLGLFVLIFLAGQAVATLFSIHFRTALFGYYSRLNGGFFSSLAYAVLVLTLLSNVPRKYMGSLLLTNVLAAVLAAVYAIPEHFGASPSCLLMRGGLGVDCWKQDVQARVFATFGQPNWLAAYLVGLLPFTWLFSQKHTGKQRLLWLTGTGLMLLALWYTRSRSGLLAAGGSAVVLVFFHFWQKRRESIRRFFHTKKNWLWLWVIAAGIFLAGTIGVQKLLSPVPPSFDLNQGTDSGSLRLIVWQGAIKVWQRYPLTGSGPGTFAYSFYQDRPIEHNLTSEWDFLYNKAHNEFLNYLAETGIIGWLTYVLYLGGMAVLLWRKAARSPQTESVGQAALASMIGISIAHLFGFSIVMTNVLLFLLPALALLPSENFPQVGLKKSARLLPWQKIVLSMLGITVFFLGIKIFQIWKADWWYTRAQRLRSESEYSAAAMALQNASRLSPAEPLYYDELADLLAQAALEYHLAGETAASSELAKTAIQNSDYALLLNPRHLDFYKTRARVFFFLMQIDQQYFAQAQQALRAALMLSPTDAQLWYNLGVAQYAAGQFNEAADSFRRAVELKPNYIKARSELGDLLVELGKVEEGREQYRFILENLSPGDENVREKLNSLELETAP